METREELEKAERDGATAARAGKMLNNNPHPMNSAHYWAWRSGFNGAKKNGDEVSQSPGSGTAGGYVDVDTMANALAIIDALLEFADEGKTPERLTEEGDWREWVAKTQSRLREAIDEST